ncbi:hypothetical protein D3C86_1747920 [compost metagenome]
MRIFQGRFQRKPEVLCELDTYLVLRLYNRRNPIQPKLDEWIVEDQPKKMTVCPPPFTRDMAENIHTVRILVQHPRD